VPGKKSEGWHRTAAWSGQEEQKEQQAVPSNAKEIGNPEKGDLFHSPPQIVFTP